MRNCKIQLNCSTTATHFELDTLFHNFLLEHNVIVSEEGQEHTVIVDEVIILSYKEDDENDWIGMQYNLFKIDALKESVSIKSFRFFWLFYLQIIENSLLLIYTLRSDILWTSYI